MTHKMDLAHVTKQTCDYLVKHSNSSDWILIVAIIHYLN